MIFFLSISSPPLSFSFDFSKYSSIALLMCFNPVGPAFPEHFFQILDLDIRQIKNKYSLRVDVNSIIYGYNNLPIYARQRRERPSDRIMIQKGDN
jgi:hypothetical protein